MARPSEDILWGRRLERFRNIATGMFGLIIVMGTFALTDMHPERLADLGDITCYFTAMFLLIVLLRTQFEELLDLHPEGDRTAAWMLTAVLFFATLAPFSLKLSVTAPQAVASVANYAFPVLLAMTFLTFAMTANRLVQRHLVRLASEHARHVSALRERDFLVGVLLLASLAVPAEWKLLGAMTVSSICWTASIMMAGPLVHVAHVASDRLIIPVRQRFDLQRA